MEPIKGPLKIFLGEFEVIEVGPGTLTLDLGKYVHITMHLGIEHHIKAGDKLPLFTEVGYANTRSTSVQ